MFRSRFVLALGAAAMALGLTLAPAFADDMGKGMGKGMSKGMGKEKSEQSGAMQPTGNTDGMKTMNDNKTNTMSNDMKKK